MDDLKGWADLILRIMFVGVALLMTFLILLQEGKGGGLTALGGTKAAGVEGVTNPIRRATAYLAAIFFILAISLGILNRPEKGAFEAEAAKETTTTSSETPGRPQIMPPANPVNVKMPKVMPTPTPANNVTPPKTEAPKTEAPKAEAPKTDAPKAEENKTEAPKAEAPKTDAPKTEPAKTEAPKADAPKTETPAPKPEPKTEK